MKEGLNSREQEGLKRGKHQLVKKEKRLAAAFSSHNQAISLPVCLDSWRFTYPLCLDRNNSIFKGSIKNFCLHVYEATHSCRRPVLCIHGAETHAP
jgi:hypothetical protein